MQQRQLRLGDILDDYCPRERRVTNHAVVAMIEQDVKQTRCTTCDTEHEYKHARVPRQRRKSEAPAALYSQVLAGGPKRVVHEPANDGADADPSGVQSESVGGASEADPPQDPAAVVHAIDQAVPPDADVPDPPEDVEDGPVHRPLIRATLPRIEGQPPPTRPAPEFTLRQPQGRPGRFRPVHQRGAAPFHGNRSGNSGGGGGAQRSGGGRPPVGARPGQRHGPGRKRSK